jgi:hypothetical protein
MRMTNFPGIHGSGAESSASLGRRLPDFGNSGDLFCGSLTNISAQTYATVLLFRSRAMLLLPVNHGF